MKSPSQKSTAEETASAHQVKFKFWLGFEVMEKIAKEQRLEEILPTNQLPIESHEASPARKPKSGNVEIFPFLESLKPFTRVRGTMA